MKITKVTQTPNKIETLDSWNGAGSQDIDDKITRTHLEDIVEIFQTPLTGAYNWDYKSADGRIKKLYRLGKELNWNAEIDIDWGPDFPKDRYIMDPGYNPFNGWAPFEAFSESEKLRYNWHYLAWTLAQFMHGEQGALLVASQLVSCAPSYDAKLYAASQTFDEARHVEVFTKYLQDKIGIVYPVNKHLKALLDKILTDPRWDLKFIGMQIIIEGLALAAFNTIRIVVLDPVLQNILHLVIRDEARHVTFGVNYLEQFVTTLSQEEKEDRAVFAYEACCVMRERLIAMDVFEEFGLDLEEARSKTLEAEMMEHFRNFLFTRIVPNLRRIGLLTDNVRPLFDQLGILAYENMVDDGEVDWAELEKPLYEETPDRQQEAVSAE